MSVERNYVIAAADRALMVLEVLANERELGVTEVAARMEITKSLAFRLLHTLEARGYVSRDPQRRTYSLGYRVFYLGAALGHQDSLVQATEKLMDELAALSHENVNLVVREGTHSVVVATRESRHQVRDPGRGACLSPRNLFALDRDRSVQAARDPAGRTRERHPHRDERPGRWRLFRRRADP